MQRRADASPPLNRQCAAPQGSQAADEPVAAAPAPAKAARKGMSEADKATLKLKGHRNKLQQSQQRSALLIENAKKKAKGLAQEGKKREALLVLKQKKALEVQLRSAEDQAYAMDEMISSIETAGMQAKYVASMAAGTEALKSITESMGGLEGIQDLMDDTEETRAEWEEIQESLQGTLNAEDEEEVLAELAMLEEMEAAELDMQLPVVPTTEPTGVLAAAEVEVEVVAEPEPARAAPERQMVAA